MQALKEEILALGGELQGALSSSISGVVTEALATVRKQYSQIAVIGQIKAGKSSLINALVRRPGLLPTDVNPWTAVVTRLHFARPGQEQSGALFSFFSGDEWRLLAQGGGRLRELSERLLPGVEESELRAHMEAMQRRAEMRLGKHYEHILGKTHWYTDPSSEVIERYVCSGAHHEELLREPAAGRFADITKTADLFFEADPFVYPSTVIDTPGTNDPLLIRDEITLRNIEHADVYIVVLTARQPLTSADLALLRILHGLQKDRIIIFINRIDDASNVAADSQRAIAGVRGIIAREFPSSNIPVIAGCALWANSALDIASADLDHVWTPEFTEYASQLGVIHMGEPAWHFGAHALPGDRLSEMLFECSGLSRLAALVSDLMLKGAGGYWLNRLAATLLAASDSMVAAARNELTAMEGMLGSVQQNVSLHQELDGINHELSRLRGHAAEVERFLQALEQELKYQTEENLSILREQLDGDIQAFAAHQAGLLAAAWRESGGYLATWRCDTSILRNRLEEDVVNAFWAAEIRLVDAQRKAAPELQRILRDAAPEMDFTLAPTSLLSFNLTPSLAPLSKTSALDLGDHWWRQWWNKEQTGEHTAYKLRDLVMSEFALIADELTRSAGVELQKYVASAIQRFFMICSSAVKLIIEREQALADACQTMMAANSAAATAAVVRQQEEQIAKIRQRIVIGEDLSKRLGAFIARYSALAAEEQRAAV